MADMNTYLRLMVEGSASDVFLTKGAPPSIKIDGVVNPLVAPKLMVGEVKEMDERIMTAAKKTIRVDHGKQFFMGLQRLGALSYKRVSPTR